jgi:hypothetical protein
MTAFQTLIATTNKMIETDSEKSEFNAILNKIKNSPAIQCANFDSEYVRNYELLKKQQATPTPAHVVKPEEKEEEVKVEVEKKPRKQMTPEAKAAAAKKRADTIAAKKAANS